MDVVLYDSSLPNAVDAVRGASRSGSPNGGVRAHRRVARFADPVRDARLVCAGEEVADGLPGAVATKQPQAPGADEHETFVVRPEERRAAGAVAEHPRDCGEELPLLVGEARSERGEGCLIGRMRVGELGQVNHGALDLDRAPDDG